MSRSNSKICRPVTGSKDATGLRKGKLIFQIIEAIVDRRCRKH